MKSGATATNRLTGFPVPANKAFDSQTAATIAFRGDPDDQASIIEAIAAHRAEITKVESRSNLFDIPEINLDAIAVDGACSGVPGPMEYRGVDVKSGIELFHVGPLDDGTNNVAEYLALIHALAYLYQKGDRTTPVYSDSKIARGWVKTMVIGRNLKGHRAMAAFSNCSTGRTTG